MLCVYTIFLIFIFEKKKHIHNSKPFWADSHHISLSWKRAGFDFSVMGTCPFSVSITGVSYLPYLPSHCATCGLHAAKSECPLLLHDGWTPTGISSLLKVSSFSFSPGVMSDVNDSRVSLQELINRHLITMAQIDHSENPGRRLWDFKVLSSWTRVKIISELWVCLKLLPACLALCALVFLFFFMLNDVCLQQMCRLRLTATTACFPSSPSPRQTACRRPATSVTSPPVIRRSTARMICLTAWGGYTVRNYHPTAIHLSTSSL